MYMYRELEPGLFTVGFYAPTGKWMPESDWPNAESAAERVNFLNGGNKVELEFLASTVRKMYERQENEDERKELLNRDYGKWSHGEE